MEDLTQSDKALGRRESDHATGGHGVSESYKNSDELPRAVTCRLRVLAILLTFCLPPVGVVMAAKMVSKSWTLDRSPNYLGIVLCAVGSVLTIAVALYVGFLVWHVPTPLNHGEFHLDP